MTLRAHYPLVQVWRLVLENTSPLSIAQGKSDLVDDILLATTPCGLPFIPATSFTGVLRSTLAASHGTNWANALFGHILGNGSIASRYECTHAHIHDARDRALGSILEAPDSDPILAPLVHRLPTKRKRVRINAHGTAADTGLFDRTVVPTGHRFSMELRAFSQDTAQAAEVAEALLAVLQSGGLNVGGSTRSGLGQLHVVRGATRLWDLRQRSDLDAWLDLHPHVDRHEGMTPMSFQATVSNATLSLKLQCEGALRVGQGSQAHTPLGKEKLPDALPYIEPVVERQAGQPARLDSRIVLPATAFKGALAHRIAFHDARLRGQWASAEGVQAALQSNAARSLGVEQIFGAIKDKSNESRAGVLRIEEFQVHAGQFDLRAHNSIDRFTGGVRDGALFSEENLFRPTLSTAIHFATQWLHRVDDTAWQALTLALQDLCEGRLAMGAGSRGGLGYVTAALDTAQLNLIRQSAQEATA